MGPPSTISLSSRGAVAEEAGAVGDPDPHGAIMSTLGGLRPLRPHAGVPIGPRRRHRVARRLRYRPLMPGPRHQSAPLERVRLGRMLNPVRGLIDATAAIVALIGGVVLLVKAPSPGTKIAVVVFALGMIGLYTTSSLYHSIPWSERWKQRMQRTDHSMIFVLIAASYTPVTVLTTDGWTTVAVLAIAWGITLAGVAQQVFFPVERNTLGITLMTTLGWIGLILLPWVATTAGWAFGRPAGGRWRPLYRRHGHAGHRAAAVVAPCLLVPRSVPRPGRRRLDASLRRGVPRARFGGVKARSATRLWGNLE